MQNDCTSDFTGIHVVKLFMVALMLFSQIPLGSLARLERVNELSQRKHGTGVIA